METEKKFLMRCKKLLKKGADSSVALLVERRIKKFEELNSPTTVNTEKEVKR